MIAANPRLRVGLVSPIKPHEMRSRFATLLQPFSHAVIRENSRCYSLAAKTTVEE